MGGGLISVLNLPLTWINKAFFLKAWPVRSEGGTSCGVGVQLRGGLASFFLTTVGGGMHLFCLYWSPSGVSLFSL